MKQNILLFLVVAIITILISSTAVFASTTKGLNAECEVNNSDKACDAGLICVPFNAESGNGKCQLNIPTPTSCKKPTVSPTLSVTPTAGESGELTPIVSPTPQNSVNLGGVGQQPNNPSDGKHDGNNSCQFDKNCHIPDGPPATGRGE